MPVARRILHSPFVYRFPAVESSLRKRYSMMSLGQRSDLGQVETCYNPHTNSTQTSRVLKFRPGPSPLKAYRLHNPPPSFTAPTWVTCGSETCGSHHLLGHEHEAAMNNVRSLVSSDSAMALETNFNCGLKYVPGPFNPRCIPLLAPNWGLYWNYNGPYVTTVELVAGNQHFHDTADTLDAMHAAGMELRIRFFGEDGSIYRTECESTRESWTRFEKAYRGRLGHVPDLANVHQKLRLVHEAIEAVWESVATTYWSACRPGLDGHVSKECANTSLFGIGSRMFFTGMSTKGLTYTPTFGHGPEGDQLPGRVASFDELFAASADGHLQSHEAWGTTLNYHSPANFVPGEADPMTANVSSQRGCEGLPED